MKYFIVAGLLLITTVMVTSTHAQENKVEEELPPGWIEIPKTPLRLKIGGYVKFDLIHDFDPINSQDFFDVSKIPTDGSKGESTHMHAKETRIFMDFRSPSKVGELRGYIEGDFYGSGGAFRLRHGYLEIAGKWLAGQTWTNFMDESMIPPTLDFEKPAAYAFARHGLFRYKHSFTKDTYLALAVEEPSAGAQAPTQPGKLESPLPDFTARYRITKHWGHLQLSGFAGQLRFQPTTGSADDVWLYGVNLSGQFVLLKKDKLSYQIIYGPGVARYRGGLSAGLDENGSLEALVGTGYTVTYLHYWSNAFSSLLVFNYGEDDNTPGQPASDVSRINYIAVNFLWHFAENAFAGIEYLHGTREDIDNSDGTAERLQFSVRYSFNMN
jgi:DcaP outer membrane protein